MFLSDEERRIHRCEEPTNRNDYITLLDDETSCSFLSLETEHKKQREISWCFKAIPLPGLRLIVSA